MEFREAAGQADIRAYLQVLSRRKLTVGLVTVSLVALALAYSLVKTPIYTAHTQVLVPEQSAGSVLQPTANQQDPAASSAQRSLTDAQQFAQGDETKAAALALLHYNADVSVTASLNDDVLTFTASSADKVQAAAMANGYAKAYISADGASQVAQYTGQMVALQTSIAKLQRTAASLPAGSEPRAAAASSITALTQSIQQLQATSELVAQTGPSIVNAATTPTSPSSPKPERNVFLALVLGLILGIGLAFLRDRLDDKVKSPREVEAASGGLPIVGTIPMVESWKKTSAPHIAFWEAADSNVSEAYRTLRTSIQFLGIEETQRVIGITSSLPDEGKTTGAANLAVSFARAGQRVIVMSCDFRRPRLHHFFGLENEVGATSVLLGQSTLGAALKSIPDEPNLRVLTSGPVPPNPAEILSLDRVRQLIDELATKAEVVLLDCPPVLPVTDTLLISRLCDSLLVIGVAGATKTSDLRHTYDLLAQVQAPVRGTILNRVPRRGAYAYGYGYGYGYSTIESKPGPAQAQTTARLAQPVPVGAASSGNGPADRQDASTSGYANGQSGAPRHGNGDSPPGPSQSPLTPPAPVSELDTQDLRFSTYEG